MGGGQRRAYRGFISRRTTSLISRPRLRSGSAVYVVPPHTVVADQARGQTRSILCLLCPLRLRLSTDSAPPPEDLRPSNREDQLGTYPGIDASVHQSVVIMGVMLTVKAPHPVMEGVVQLRAPELATGSGLDVHD